MRRSVVLVLCLGAAACAPIDTPPDASTGDGRPCASQLDCTTASELNQTCDHGFCSGPVGEKDLVHLFITRKGNAQIGNVTEYVVYPLGETRPDGSAVSCDAVLAGTTADLKDPTKYNLLGSPDTRNCASCGTGDVATATFLDRTGRALYVELYDSTFTQALIGRGCVAPAEFKEFPDPQDPRHGTPYVEVIAN